MIFSRNNAFLSLEVRRFSAQCDLLNIWKISQKFIKTLLWKISFFGLFSVLSVQKIFFGVLRMTSFFSIPWNCWEISQNLWKNPNFLALFGFFEKKFLRGCPSEFSALWDFSEKKNPRKRKFYFQLIVFCSLSCVIKVHAVICALQEEFAIWYATGIWN